MTRNRLFEIAMQFGLKCDVERVTTGEPHKEAFREFEFIGEAGACADAARIIRKEWDVSRDFCTARLSDHDCKPYVHVSSFYCGPAPVDVGD